MQGRQSPGRQRPDAAAADAAKSRPKKTGKLPVFFGLETDQLFTDYNLDIRLTTQVFLHRCKLC